MQGLLSEEVGYVSMPESVYKAAMRRVELRETGTAYGVGATRSALTGNEGK